jgi:DNA polymerase
MNALDKLYEDMKKCKSCGLREGCSQVVTAVGQTESPLLLLVGESPGQEEDTLGEPFVGKAGQLLREIIRETRVLNKNNTLISNTIHCRPPKNKFPPDEMASVCVSTWLLKEIELAKPERMLLIGAKALWYVARMEGITACRGKWYDIRGIRTMATFHPSYVLRCEGEGKTQIRKLMEQDIGDVAEEVQKLEVKNAGKENQ